MSEKPMKTDRSLADFLNITEAAAFLGVSPSTLRNWDQSGAFTAVRHPINNYRLYRKDDLNDFLAQLRGKGGNNTKGAKR